MVCVVCIIFLIAPAASVLMRLGCRGKRTEDFSKSVKSESERD